METILYSARMDNNVLSVPVPAINGNANGTTDAVDDISSFAIFIPKIISNAMMNNNMEPAMAKSPI